MSITGHTWQQEQMFNTANNAVDGFGKQNADTRPRLQYATAACSRRALWFESHDAEKFLIKSVGTKTEFSQDDLTNQFFGEFSTKTKSQIAQYVIKHRVGFKYLSAYLDELSEYLKGVLNPFWDNLGLELLQFNITTIDIDKSTEEGRIS